MIFGLFRGNANRSIIARLHGEIVAAARDPVLFTDYGIADDIDGRFESVALHAALLLRRLRQLPAPGPEIAQDLADALFRHFDIALREMGIGDMSVPKQMKRLAEAFFGRADAYDKALAEGHHALCDALARNVYAGRRDADRLARYVESVDKDLAGLTLSRVLKSAIFLRRYHGLKRCLMPTSDSQSAAFSHPIDVETVPEQGLDVSISADAAARQALAKADGLPAVASLEADFHIARQGLAQFNVSGTVRARVTQICVVSLEPFESDIVEDVDVDFAEPAAVLAAAARAGSLVSAPGAPERDPPDPIVDGTIDLGALAAEFLALGLDPYPRKPGVEFAPMRPEHEDNTAKPFDVLRKLTDKS